MLLHAMKGDVADLVGKGCGDNFHLREPALFRAFDQPARKLRMRLDRKDPASAAYARGHGKAVAAHMRPTVEREITWRQDCFVNVFDNGFEKIARLRKPHSPAAADPEQLGVQIVTS